MDGYAVRAEDTAGASRATPRTLRCIEKVFTGQMPEQTVGPGRVHRDCHRRADARRRRRGRHCRGDRQRRRDVVRVFAAGRRRGQNIGRQGADIQKGQHGPAAGTTAQRQPGRAHWRRSA